MKRNGFSFDAVLQLCLRRCDTIFYTLVAIVALARAIVDVQHGTFSVELYSPLVNLVGYRELLRLFLWARENPRYAIASLYGAVVASALPVMFTHPSAFLFEATVYLLLRLAAGLLFALDERQVVKLYREVLFDYYNRKPPSPRDRKRRKSLIDRLAIDDGLVPDAT
ncbi:MULTISPECIES: hypothetical protein [Methylosinus]|uniref:Uncharacterized protein n=1 Tax=Methylosinus trichosporium (strain ATCC 35070 / NCIMB 11131 / UNIQEM 75 / OB3b) TaxID=595536 RepID=A0A2D2D1F5_METT3|nr:MULTISPECIES: hypothetical protein [Methylosinus]ATQ68841.1 hypothetical protein CQW49_13820 [Methylosinus trichosporium OB3b]OBS52248.1 hypothetical protein A8B73_11655 [Methylosinus sp. 3S-1]